MMNKRKMAAARAVPVAAALVFAAAMLAACTAQGDGSETGADGGAAALAGEGVAAGSTQDGASPSEAAGAEPDAAAGGALGAAGLSAEALEALSPDSDLLVPVKYVMEARDAGVDIVFVDARPELDYEFGHIPGAINVPYFAADEHLSELPRDRLIVAYCECPHAEAVQVADALVADGFPQVKVIDEGLFGWTELGGETVAGSGDTG
ncbi:MAG: rhodanese-like domain-containing protein [Anaerolineae bacterium]